MRIFVMDSGSEPDEAPAICSSKQNQTEQALVLAMAAEGWGSPKPLCCETQRCAGREAAGAQGR